MMSAEEDESRKMGVCNAMLAQDGVSSLVIPQIIPSPPHFSLPLRLTLTMRSIVFSMVENSNKVLLVTWW